MSAMTLPLQISWLRSSSCCRGKSASTSNTGGMFITSGIINTKEQDVKDAMNANPELEIVETTYQGDWVSITARRK